MKVLFGHLTAKDKQAIKAIQDYELKAGKVGNKTYHISEPEEGVYTVKILQKDRGLIPCAGSELRERTTTNKFKL